MRAAIDGNFEGELKDEFFVSGGESLLSKVSVEKVWINSLDGRHVDCKSLFAKWASYQRSIIVYGPCSENRISFSKLIINVFK